jgi:error-prone DNA polymerase
MTDPAGYVELHARSAFSFLRGGSLPEHLAAEAAALGLPALALCDRDGVYGAPRLYHAGRDHGIRALVGCELTLADGAALPLLVADGTGYRNLCRLLTTARLVERSADLPFPDARERKRPCYATWEELAAHADGLIALTGDADGPVLRAWATGGPEAAAAALLPLIRIFGPRRLFIEVQRHRVRGETRTEAMLDTLARRFGLAQLATGGVAYARPEDREIADVFTCLRHHTTLDGAGRLLAPNSARHLRGPVAMQHLFADRPALLAQAGAVADELAFTLRDLGYQFPTFPTPPGESADSWLRHQTLAAAPARFPVLTARHRAQLDRELTVIAKLGFAGYFLCVWDICRWARERGILVQGRGSAANSAVCFALGITAVDPIARGLLFERFLSEGRVGADGHPSWPDIDLDLPSGELRESVLQEVFRRQGPRGAAMTANVITYRGRNTARELGKVLGLPEDLLDRFSRLFASGDYPHTVDLARQLALAGLPASHPRFAALTRLYARLRGLPRHLGQHSGGMVLGAGSLDTIVPLEPASMPGRVVVQWDKDDCEELGIVKVDFLGLGMMAVLQECLHRCAQRGGPVELSAIPQDDPATYEAMCRADTLGTFQIESRAQMATLPRLRPRAFYDVAMQVAVVRPGPVVGQLVHPLLRRRAGEEPETCIDESLNEVLHPILGRTHGVVLFQEQMLAVAMTLAGFSGSEAEELRRSLGFKRSGERLQRVLTHLRRSLIARGITEVVAEKIVATASSFALYGFPESHALSFALLAYASTWLKVHRPAEFCASLLNHQPMGFYSPATIVQDARRHGVRVLPVCVQASAQSCEAEDEGPHGAARAVRLGLGSVQGLRRSTIAALLTARAERPFRSLADFLARTPANPAERRLLAGIGALNALADHRRAALWQVESAWTLAEPLLLQHDEPSSVLEPNFPGKSASPLAGAPSSEPARLWEGADPTDHAASAGDAPRDATSGTSRTLAATTACPLPPMSVAERQSADLASLGLNTGPHPLARLRPQLNDAWCAADLSLGADGTRLTIAGCVICRQRPGTAKGTVFVSLEDETGIANAIVRPALFERFRRVISEEPALRITGRLQHRAGVIHVLAEEFAALPLGDLLAPASHDFH